MIYKRSQKAYSSTRTQHTIVLQAPLVIFAAVFEEARRGQHSCLTGRTTDLYCYRSVRSDGSREESSSTRLTVTSVQKAPDLFPTVANGEHGGTGKDLE